MERRVGWRNSEASEGAGDREQEQEQADRRRPHPRDCKMKTKMKASCGNKAKRPPNAYIIFQQEFKRKILILNKVVNISKAASKEWYRLGPLGQAPYYAEYRRLMEGYTLRKDTNSNSCGDAGYERKTTKVCSRDKAKRPLAVFFIFKRKFKEMHPEIKKVVEIAKAASEEWRTLSDVEKDPYIKEYDRQMKDYVEWKTRSVMPPQLDDTPRQAYATTPGQGRSTPAAATRGGEEEQTSSSSNQGRRGGADQQQQQPREEGSSRSATATRGGDNNSTTVTDSVALQEQIVELECKFAQQHQLDSEVAKDSAKKEIAYLKQRIEELLFENKDLQIKLRDSMLQRLDHLDNELLDLDFDTKLHEVPQPCASEEAMCVSVQHHRILRSSNSADKRVPSSVLAAPPDAVGEMNRSKGEDSHPAAAASIATAAARKNAGRNRSLQVGEVRPAKRVATSSMVTAAQSAVASRVSRQRQPAASTRKTRGWVW